MRALALLMVLCVVAPWTSYAKGKKPAAEQKAPDRSVMQVAGVDVPVPPESEGALAVTAALTCGDKLNSMLKHNEIMRDALKELSKDRRPCHAAALVRLCMAIEADRAAPGPLKEALRVASRGSVAKHSEKMCAPKLTEEEVAYILLLPSFLPEGVVID